MNEFTLEQLVGSYRTAPTDLLESVLQSNLIHCKIDPLEKQAIEIVLKERDRTNKFEIVADEELFHLVEYYRVHDPIPLEYKKWKYREKEPKTKNDKRILENNLKAIDIVLKERKQTIRHTNVEGEKLLENKQNTVDYLYVKTVTELESIAYRGCVTISGLQRHLGEGFVKCKTILNRLIDDGYISKKRGDMGKHILLK